MHDLPIVDGHLDLAENVTIFGRDLALTVAALRATEKRISRQATVSLPELERGGIAVACATVTAGFLAEDLGPNDDFVPKWWRLGLRMVGITFGDTVYGRGVAGGSATFRQGGLTRQGVALLDAMAEQGFIWDVSHLTEEGIWQGLDRTFPRVCATHANVRAHIPTDRHLGDDVIRVIGEHDGVIGLVLYNGFLDPRWREDRSIVVTRKEQFRLHAEHIARVSGWNHVGIGSDLDGGLGLEESPVEIDSVADRHKVGDAIPAEARAAVLSTNWIDFLRFALPRTPS